MFPKMGWFIGMLNQIVGLLTGVAVIGCFIAVYVQQWANDPLTLVL